jgi:biotin transport system substrate-specific component
VALLLLLVAVGLPLLAGGRGGLGVFATPSAGFLLCWPVAAFVVGWLTERGGPTYHLPWGIFSNVVGGIVVLYAAGIAGIALVAGVSVQAAAVSTWIFIPGDLVKAVLAALVARGVHAAYPGLLGRQRVTEPESSTV